MESVKKSFKKLHLQEVDLKDFIIESVKKSVHEAGSASHQKEVELAAKLVFEKKVFVSDLQNDQRKFRLNFVLHRQIKAGQLG